MLRLASDTPEGWVDAAAAEVDTLLLDHAHCEKKAASTAINLLFRYSDKPELVRALSALAREELEHFEQVLDLLDARGVPFERLEPSPYAGRLLKAIRPEEPHRLIDTLLCCALIEARSCERMKALSEGLPDAELRAMYKALLASEARHFQTYVDLADRWADPADVRARLTELAAHEASVLVGDDEPFRMHSRWPA